MTPQRSLFSTIWYRVRHLKPALAGQARIARHMYRGQVWYVLEDPIGERHHRFPPATYFVIGLFDGVRTMDAIWRAALDRLGDDAPTQDEMIQLLVQLDAADLITAGVSAELGALALRAGRENRKTWLKAASAPLAHRMPLLRGDACFQNLAPLGRALFGPVGILVWMTVVAGGLLLALVNWPSIASAAAAQTLAPWTLAAFALAYVALKAVHETCHGLALKAFGGRVGEIGLMFLLFVPMPYVDASASTSFASKWQRIVVGSAGVMAELFCASIALALWLVTEAGAVRDFLFAVTVVGSVSSLLFNGNPLLKFDGYYVLGDLIEIPNLGPRSSAYLQYLWKRYGAGIPAARSPVTAPGERIWFLIYGPASAIYRIVLAFSIALYLAGGWPLIGMLLALWTLMLMILWPMARGIRAALAGSEGGTRSRVAAVSLAAFLAGVLFLVPAPRATMAQGVWSVPEHGHVRAESEGTLAGFMAVPGDIVSRHQALAVVDDPTAVFETRAVDAEIDALEARLTAAAFADPALAGQVRDELAVVRQARERLLVRAGATTIRAAAGGSFLRAPAFEAVGRFIPRGSLVGYVAKPETLVAVAVVGQEGAHALQEGVMTVEMREADAGEVSNGRIVRVVPGGQNRLPHPSLAADAGGPFPLDPGSGAGMRTAGPVFQVELAPDRPPIAAFVGRRFHVRFVHEPEPLGFQALRAVRQLVSARLAG